MKFEIEQELWFEWSDYGSQKGKCEAVKITKVGRSWLELSNGLRASVKDLNVDGGKYASPGRCYLSKTEINERREIDREWYQFRRAIPYLAPDGISVDAIRQAAKILGINDK